MRYGAGLDPDFIRKVFVKFLHEKYLLLYAKFGDNLLRKVKFIEEIVIGSLEMIG